MTFGVVAVIGFAKTGSEAWRPTTPGNSARIQRQIISRGLGDHGAPWFAAWCVLCAIALAAAFVVG